MVSNKIEFRPWIGHRQLLIATEDLGRMFRHEWIAIEDHDGHTHVYREVNELDGRHELLQNFIVKVSVSAVVQHSNGDRLDFRKANLKVLHY